MKNFQSKIGVTFSGGGMRGMAHIGTIKAMREFNVEADIVSGASIGALVGAMYATDLTTDEMLDFFKNINLFDPRNYAFSKPGLINTERFRPYLEKILPKDSFAALSKILYVSITNLLTGENQLVESGSLYSALMCSAAMPGVFAPVKVDDNIYTDGGITNNFPIEPLNGRCNLIIGSYVNPLVALDKTTEFKNAIAVLDRSLVISTYRMESQSFQYADIFIQPEKINRLPVLGMNNIDKCYIYGYDEASKQLELYFKEKEKQ